MPLIDKQAALDAAIKADMENHNGILSEKRARVFEEHISILPTAQPKRGKWVEYDGDWLKTMCKCSECGAMIDINEKYRNFFCYHCGARMRGVGKEKEKQNEQY